MSATAPCVWVIGDLQGCKIALDRLLASPEIASDPASRFWFAGDLINRGPDSLGALRTVMALQDRAVAVLGNHDLHLLAVVAGVRKPSKSDTLDSILQAPDLQELIDWLRHRPLVHYEYGHLLVHAGVLPAWTIEKTLALAAELQQALRGPDWQTALQGMYGNAPVRWNDALQGSDRLRVIVNSMTRMRLCNDRGDMDFSSSAPPKQGAALVPWFDVHDRKAAGVPILFGHWSQLGLMMRPDVVCLDSGCVWGAQLSAMRLQDRKLVQVNC